MEWFFLSLNEIFPYFMCISLGNMRIIDNKVRIGVCFMLIQFSVGNFLSFKDTVTLSMVASRIQEHKDSHVCTANNLKLLKSAVLYGANASGKSNLFKAMSF